MLTRILDAFVERRMVRRYQATPVPITDPEREPGTLADLYRETRAVEPTTSRFRDWRRRWQLTLTIAAAVIFGIGWQTLLTPNPVRLVHLIFGAALVVPAILLNAFSVLIDRRMDAHGWRLAVDSRYTPLDSRVAAQVFSYPDLAP